jgi:hypothetical protein
MLFISERKPQISLTVPIYYELHDLLDKASKQKGRFINLPIDIILAVKVLRFASICRTACDY